MRKIRFRVILPIIFGFLALALFAWDYQNNRVVAEMGMGWDMGPPIWPYRAVALFVFAVNAPAYLISWPILNVLHLRTLELHYAVWFPAIILLWWLTGTWIDFGLVTQRASAHRKRIAGLFLTAGIALLAFATQASLHEYHSFLMSGPGQPPIYVILTLRTIGPVFWSIFFATGLFRSALRLIRFQLPVENSKPLGHRTYLLCAAVICLNAAGVSALDRVLSPPPDLNYCETDYLRRLGCVHGTLVDDHGKPAAHVEVDLIPTFKTGDARWLGTKDEQSDEQGRYNFNFVDHGEYLVAINPTESSEGPDKDNPYETRYYRQANSESGAEKVAVVESTATNLDPLKLDEAKFTTIEVSVEWADGTRPERSDISVRNTRYSERFGHLTQIENGVGTLGLAQGFEYVANAQLDCAGPAGRAQRRLALPSEKFKVVDSQPPMKVRLVLIGERCEPQ
jgi:hypothetical protein